MSGFQLRRALRRSDEEPSINLTPLIDVVFVILIMFILVAPLLELDQIELAIGGTADKENVNVQESSPVTIHVRKDNSIWIKQQQIQIENLEDLLRQAKIEYPEATPQLFHDRHAEFGTYQSIKNAAENAGFLRMDVILNPS